MMAYTDRLIEAYDRFASERDGQETEAFKRRIGRINGVFRKCARSRGGPAVHLGPGRRGIACRSGGMGGSCQAGNRAFRAEMLRCGTQEDVPPPLGCRKALSVGVFEFRLWLGTRRGDGRRV